MKTLPAPKLAEELELEPTETAYFNYIIKSYENGQNDQVEELFDRMETHNKVNFIGRCQLNNKVDILTTLLIRKM